MDTGEIRRLVTAAGFIFRGRIEPNGNGEAPTIPAEAGETITVRIEDVLRSTPALRNLAGQKAFVMTGANASRKSRSLILFAECISLGQQLLLREIGHVEASDTALRQVAEAIRAEDERPLHERIAAADLIVEGEVIESRPLDRHFPPRSEHDPLWSLARVTISAVLKGRKPRSEIDVLYASSDDRVWFHSPKLHVGVSGIFLLFRLNEAEVPKDLPRSAYQATDPLDFLPHRRRGEVERLLAAKREDRRDV